MSTDEKFLTGINVGWFSGQYDHDIGRNQFSLGRLYRDSVGNLSLPDSTPALPFLTENPEFIREFFHKIRNFGSNPNENESVHNFDTQFIIRLWAFERFEGLLFDNELNVIGLDAEFLKNITKVFDLAEEFNIQIYLCLFDAWPIYDDVPISLKQVGKDEHYFLLQKSWKQNLKRLFDDSPVQMEVIGNKLTPVFDDNSPPMKFVFKALKPLITLLSTKNALYGIDLFNEPESLISKYSFSFSQVRNYLFNLSNHIHNIDSTIKVSCGFQHLNTLKNHAKELTFLDFYDFHLYDENGNVESYHPSNFDNKPCIIGECGYPVHKGTSNREKNLSVARIILESSQKKGYVSTLAWIENYENGDEILDFIKDFATRKLSVIKSKSTSTTGSEKKCFIATVAMGTDLDENVNYLRQVRDNFLLYSKYRVFLELFLVIYYATSPPIANFIEKHNSLKTLTRNFLIIPIVKILKIIDRTPD